MYSETVCWWGKRCVAKCNVKYEYENKMMKEIQNELHQEESNIRIKKNCTSVANEKVKN